MNDDRLGSIPHGVVFYGAGGYAASIVDYVLSWEPAPFATAVAYIDDFHGDDGSNIHGSPVISFETWRSRYREFPVFVTVAQPAARRKLADRIRAAGGRFMTFSRPEYLASRGIIVGDGSFVVRDAWVGAGTTIGEHVHFMVFASVYAGCRIGSYVTVCPSSTIWGPCVIEDEVFIGVGARIVNETEEPLTIGARAVIAAGAVVTRSVKPGEKLAGNPAMDFRSLAAARRTT